MTISEQIKLLRRKSGLSQNDLREIMGFKSLNSIQNWESNKTEPSLEQIRFLNKALKWVFIIDYIRGTGELL